MMLWIFLGLACEGSKNTLDVDGDGVIASLDCDDDNPNVSPNLPELCDGIDNNCDGAVDNSPTDGDIYYLDADGDNYGSIAFYILSCEPVDNYSENSDDCDDSNLEINPDAVDVCDGIDNNGEHKSMRTALLAITSTWMVMGQVILMRQQAVNSKKTWLTMRLTVTTIIQHFRPARRNL